MQTRGCDGFSGEFFGINGKDIYHPLKRNNDSCLSMRHFFLSRRDSQNLTTKRFNISELEIESRLQLLPFQKN